MSLIDFVPWTVPVVIGISKVKKIEITKKTFKITFK